MFENGRQWMPSHSDNEECIEENSEIVTVSLGTTRELVIKEYKSGKVVQSACLEHGSVTKMSKYSQTFYRNEITEDHLCLKPRISLTFRLIKNPEVHAHEENTNNAKTPESSSCSPCGFVPYPEYPPQSKPPVREPLNGSTQPKSVMAPARTSSVLYISSSMFRHIDTKKLSSKNVEALKLFYPGANASIMLQKLKKDLPTLNAKPSAIYIMSGTNNVDSIYYGSRSLTGAIDDLTELLEYLRFSFPGVDINVLNILPRSTKGKNDVVMEINRLLKNFCKSSGIRRDRRVNIITELKAKSAINDLKGVWKTIKTASNLPTKVSNTSCNLDADESNKFFAQIGPNIQEEVGVDNDGNEDNSSYQKFLDDACPADHQSLYLEAFDEVSESEVLEFMKSIPGDKATNDPIPLKIFKQILPSFISAFTHIVNLSLKYGVMPNSCKVAIVTPIHKSGEVDVPDNYRPISILPVLSKTIEHFVNSQLTQYLDDRGLISKCQYGFRKDHSTTYLMLDLFDRIYTSKSKNNHPGIIFLDIKKAFDTVNHDILLSKLKHYGIKSIALDWFISFLRGRKQQTRVGSRTSDFTEITSGVPQGSILGPILFTIFINDLPTACIQSTPYLFADDGALYFNNINRENYSNIQLEMKSIFKWLQANKLALNCDKTNFLIFDSSNNLDDIPIEINNDLSLVIHESKSQKYLGLIVDNKLNFYQHIEYIKKKVSKRIGAMYRSKSLLPLKFRKMFANALMLPHFDYLDIIWSKTYKTKLKELDIYYKKVAKIALDVHPKESSISVYKQMGWLPLHLRRQLHLSNYMYRIVNEHCPKHFIGKFIYISGGSRGGESCNLYTQKSKSHKEFFYLGAKAWNIIPQTLRASQSIKKFSNTFKSLLLSKFSSDNTYQTDNSFNKFYLVE
ncbi:hypothetical protein ACHWQZ_G015036 [Mnemiopsis leidyi]